MGPIENSKSEMAGDAGSPDVPEATDRADEGQVDPARLFIAIKLPDEVVAQVTDLMGNLKKGFGFTSCRPAWSDPETLHLTLRFLGPTRRQDIDRIKAELAKLAKGHDRPNLRIMGLDVFPDWRRPKVLWVGVKDKSEALARLQAEIESQCAAWGLEPEVKPFRPHLTLARFKGQKGVGAAREIVAGHKGFRSDRFVPGEIVIFESVLSPRGASHAPLSFYPLG